VFEAKLKNTFAACYVKTLVGYTIWSKVITNDWYEQYCGLDYKDWNSTGEFSIKGVLGEGIGTEIA